MRANPRIRNLSFVIAVGLVLSACAGGSGPAVDASHSRSRAYYKVGSPYQINGVWYYPKVDYDYDQTGIASWYGEAFNGKPTANGEIYDLTQVSAAHKTLQLPSIVEVTNLKNGRALQVRVNDRGPYVGDRIIDLSRRTAQLLGFEGAGTAPVRVRVLKEQSIQVAEAAMRGQIISPGSSSAVMVAQAPRSAPVRMAAVAPRPMPQSAPVMAARPTRAPIAPAPAPRYSGPVVAAALSPAPQAAPMAAVQRAPAAKPAPAVAAARRSWPSLIASAQAAEAIHVATGGPRAGPAPRHGRIFVQAGAFSVPENAQRVRARIASLGSAEVLRAMVNGTAMYRVRVGPVANGAEARRLLSRVLDSGYPGARIVDE